jgi:hypothetical protein
VEGGQSGEETDGNDEDEGEDGDEYEYEYEEGEGLIRLFMVKI